MAFKFFSQRQRGEEVADVLQYDYLPESFRNQLEFVKDTKDFDFKASFLDRIVVQPSGNYATHHSIANEWAILRWAKALQIESVNIDRIESTPHGPKISKLYEDLSIDQQRDAFIQFVYLLFCFYLLCWFQHRNRIP